MNRKDTTPPQQLRTPPPWDLPVQEDIEDSDPQEEDVPDILSEELFPLNIIPFSDNDNDDPDYQAPQAIEEEDSTSSSSEDEEDDNMANVGQQANAAPVPAVSGGQLSYVSPFTKVSMD